MAKDYYKLLGVDRTATQEQIKKAFRKKAMQYHPDRATDKVAAEAKFKEINEAYAVLGDEAKRKQYDMFGAEGFGQRFSQQDIFRDFNFGSVQDILGDMGFGGDIFSRIFGGGGGRSGFGGGPFGADFGGRRARAQPVKGQDARSTLQISFEEAVLGGERQISLATADAGHRSLSVKIPPGARDGTTLRLKGQGGASAGGPAGDLFLSLQVAPHPTWRWRGERDLELDVEVRLSDLVLGGSVDVPTLRDGAKRVKVRAGTRPGSAIRLPGFGVPGNRRAPAGDLYAVIQARVPEQLSAEQQALWEQLRASGL